jgi:hypothetical protein
LGSNDLFIRLALAKRWLEDALSLEENAGEFFGRALEKRTSGFPGEFFNTLEDFKS